MLYTQIQPQSLFGSGEKRFLSIFTIYGHGSHLVQRCGTIWTSCLYSFNKTTIWNLVKIGQDVSEKTFKDCTIIYMYLAQGE